VNNLGLIHIYTGDGKGKTTASVGLAIRALGSGLKVVYCSFHKKPEKYGYTEIELRYSPLQKDIRTWIEVLTKTQSSARFPKQSTPLTGC